MPEPPPTDLLSALPRSRPHRRSAKRPAPEGGTQPRAAPPRAKPAAAAKAARRKPAQAKPTAVKPAAKPTAVKPTAARSARARQPSPARLRQPAQPRGTPAPPSDASAQDRQSPPSPGDILGTAVGAAAELAEIGLTLGARALRRTLSRLPRP